MGFEGTGLGLALTRQLVELHGGRVLVLGIHSLQLGECLEELRDVGFPHPDAEVGHGYLEEISHTIYQFLPPGCFARDII